jgi:hypothetical protein
MSSMPCKFIHYLCSHCHNPSNAPADLTLLSCTPHHWLNPVLLNLVHIFDLIPPQTIALACPQHLVIEHPCNLQPGIFKRLRSPGIDSKESIPPDYVAWRAGMTNRAVVPARRAGNRFQGFLKGLKIRTLMLRLASWKYCRKCTRIYAPPVPNKKWRRTFRMLYLQKIFRKIQNEKKVVY